MEKPVSNTSKKKQYPTEEQAKSLEESNKEKALRQQNDKIRLFSGFKVGDTVVVRVKHSDERSQRVEKIQGKIIHITPWKFISIKSKTPTRTIITTVELNNYVAGKVEIDKVKGFNTI